jgi:GTP-binding protein Era
MLKNNSQCGFIAIIGRPNVGKSTLMNHLINHKISITSRKPQTTQNKINGIITLENIQYIFVDTPGFQTQYKSKLNDLMNNAVSSSLSNVDVILYVVEAGIFNSGDQQVLTLLKPNYKVILLVNKQDKLKDKLLLSEYIKQINSKFTFQEHISLSAKNHYNIDLVYTKVAPYLPISNFLYPAEQITDKSNKFLCSEIIREKLFRHLGQELPYNLTVYIDEFKTDKNKTTNIQATIIVNKLNQKSMIIGKNGSKLKTIGSEARVDIEQLLGNKVFLQLWVKVKVGFIEDKRFLEQFES